MKNEELIKLGDDTLIALYDICALEYNCLSGPPHLKELGLSIKGELHKRHPDLPYKPG